MVIRMPLRLVDYSCECWIHSELTTFHNKEQITIAGGDANMWCYLQSPFQASEMILQADVMLLQSFVFHSIGLYYDVRCATAKGSIYEVVLL